MVGNPGEIPALPILYLRRHVPNPHVPRPTQLMRHVPILRCQRTNSHLRSHAIFPSTVPRATSCAAPSPSDNSWAETRSHAPAIRADTVSSTPPTAEERDASTCGFNSGFHRRARSFTLSVPTTGATRRASCLQRLSGTNVGPCKCPTAPAGGRCRSPAPVAGASLFSSASCARPAF